MRLLVFTQKVKADDPILGFMIGWLTALSKQVETLEVICLEQGSYELPPNVRVWSLGKESGQSRLKYILNFYRLIFKLRHNYDAVWVHMNQIYVLLGFWPWRLWGKKISLWYAHGSVSWSLRLAERLADLIFTSSSRGFRLPSRKVQVVGQGIDTDKFTYRPEVAVRESGLLLHVGRISSVKRQLELVTALAGLGNQSWQLIFYGSAITPADEKYLVELKAKIEALDLSHKITFGGNLSQAELAATLLRADLFITMSRTGSLDKVVLEAMAAGVIPVVTNDAFAEVFTTETADLLVRRDEDFIPKIKELLRLEPKVQVEIRSKLRQIVVADHSLPRLMSRIVERLHHVSSTY